MLGHIGQGLLRHPQQRHLHLGVQRPRVTGRGDFGGHAAGRRPAGRFGGQRVGQFAVFQRLRPQRLDRAAGLGQAVSGQPGGVADPPVAFGLDAGLLGGLELGDDPGQALGERVVDLPGHPLPFVPRAGLPGLGKQLGLQPGVLRDHLLQPLVGLGQLDDHLLPGQVLLLGLGPQPDERPDEHEIDAAQDGPDRHRHHRRAVKSPALRHAEEDGHHRGEHPPPHPGQEHERLQEADPGEEGEPGAADGEHRDEDQQAGEVDPHRPLALRPAGMQDDHPGDPGRRGRRDADGDTERPGRRMLGQYVREEREGEEQVGHHPREPVGLMLNRLEAAVRRANRHRSSFPMPVTSGRSGPPGSRRSGPMPPLCPGTPAGDPGPSSCPAPRAEPSRAG